ncbi:MAG: recombinase RecA [Sandaracinaceae bacterium]
MMSMKDKWKAVTAACSTIEKQFGKGAIMKLGERTAEQVPAILPGCLSLAEALGCGGYPRGRVVEVYGPEGSGKTTLTLHAIAECQAAGGIAAFVDAEHALDVRYAGVVGVQTDKLLVSQPDHGEQALEIVEALVRSGAVDLVVVDSVAALVPKAEIEGDMGEPHVGLQARLMSQALRKLTSIAHRTGTCIMFINQLRMKIGVQYGSPEVTTGGAALKYYTTVRLDVRRIGQVKAGDTVVGHRAKVKIVKNKLAPPFQTAEFDIRYGVGIDAVGDLLDRAVAEGRVDKNGSYYALGETTLGQGRERARAAVLADEGLLERLQAEALGGAAPGAGVDGGAATATAGPAPSAGTQAASADGEAEAGAASPTGPAKAEPTKGKAPKGKADKRRAA